MKHDMNRSRRWRNSLLSVSLAISTLATPVVWAANPYLSGPSSAAASQTIVLSGGNYPPNSALTVKVSDSAGNEYSASIMSTADGTVRYEVVPSVEGMYSVKIFDSQQKVMSSANFGCYRP